MGGKKVLNRLSYPSEFTGLERRKKRHERTLESFDVAVGDINQRLRRESQKPLRREEFIASRLYTGPMYQKYVAHPPSSHFATTARAHPQRDFHLLHPRYNAVLRAKTLSRRGKAPKFMMREYQQLCKDNRYTTTIWVLNSAIVKLKALTAATKV